MRYFFAVAAVVMTLIFGLPFSQYPTEHLLPVLTLQLERGEDIHIVTEVGDGHGETWEAAVADLREKAPGDVFFQTAEAVVFCGAPEKEVLCSGLLRPAAKVYVSTSLQDPEGLHTYLSVHESNLTVADVIDG